MIPDEAVLEPEEWALEGAGEEPLDTVPLDPDSPLAELPEMSIPWPDELELPEFTPLEPDPEQVEFVELEQEFAPATTLTDADVVRVDEEVVLAFPADDELFPEREAFVERFQALSTLEELEGDEANLAQLAARARADEELLQTLLRVYGYYDGQVIRTVSGIRPGEETAAAGPEVRFDIIPGPHYRFGEIDLGRLSEAPDYATLRAAFEIESGDFMSSDKIVEERYDLDRALGETGYVFAEIDEPELLIDHAELEGALTMPVEPNGKYLFGEVVSNLPEFLSSSHLAEIARFDSGDVYQRSLELDLRRAIIATGLVSSVTVTPRAIAPPSDGEPGVVALDVEMEKAELRTIAGAIGYGSEEGFRVQASWEHRNLFPPEGMLRVRAIAGTREQLAGVTFRKNNFGGRDKILTIDAFATTIDSEAFDARTVSLIGTYERASTLLFQKPISYSVGLEAVATEERPAPVSGIAQPRTRFFIGAVPLYAMLDTTDDLLSPSEGFRVGLRLSPEVSRSNGVESFYLRAKTDASYYQQVSENVILAGRVGFGSIPGTSLFNIAPSRRFYAGGGGSVRGYGYQLIGPRDAQGDPIGGRSLVEGSIEARIRTGLFDGALGVVPFLDAGSVSTSVLPDFDTIRFGAGIGFRYYTGFGPLRVDFATPLNPGPEDSPIAVYVSLGQAF